MGRNVDECYVTIRGDQIVIVCRCGDCRSIRGECDHAILATVAVRREVCKCHATGPDRSGVGAIQCSDVLPRARSYGDTSVFAEIRGDIQTSKIGRLGSIGSCEGRRPTEFTVI